ncbi:putative sulfatase, transmembrane protein [Candidatus Vecturithrix granuli]|uniref:Putative sulfatase, transmembrane protein n=1 Tax=Vecturithrix granuli TaxID=1499967 RepID=A0A081BY19_VECG1|nr:putative sulfatase, transmembrane protein [Candidatus Vecturithrix granuli]
MKRQIMKQASARRRIFFSLFWFLSINAFVTILIGYQYIIHAAGVERTADYIYLHLALCSNFFLIYLVLALALLPIFWALPRKLLFILVTIPMILVVHLLTFVDTTLFRIFKFHLNSMVLNLFLTEGAWDSVHLGATTIITIVGIVGIMILFELILLRICYRRSAQFPTMPSRRNRPSWRTLLMALIIIVILADKLTYATADLYNRQEITRHRAVFPLYYGFTMKRFLRKYFRVELDREEELNLTTQTSPLNYPTGSLERQPLDQYPNMIWIIVDAWRSNMLNAEVSPHIWEFSKKALVFNNHYSGGNASRFGIFSLLFGVYSYYWHQFLGARQSSAFIDELLDLGYDFQIVSSTRLTYPEFRKTAFIKIPEAIDDRRDGARADTRDPQTAQHFLDWLASRENSAPFFSFIYFDAPHGPYSYTREFEKFTPSKKTANYVTVGKNDMTPLKNSYKNAILFDDALVGKILAYLEEHNFLDNTVVLITADHGEEFYESGFLGHTSAFSKEQTKVPLILYVPGQKHEEIQRLTSHLDVVPTMLSLLGYTSEPDVYAHGHSLFRQRAHPFIVSCGWADCAIIDESHTIVFSTETYNALFFEVRDQQYQLVANYRPILNEKYHQILEVFDGFRQFNK